MSKNPPASLPALRAAEIDRIAAGLLPGDLLRHEPGRMVVSLGQCLDADRCVWRACFVSSRPEEGRTLWIYAATEADFYALGHVTRKADA